MEPRLFLLPVILLIGSCSPELKNSPVQSTIDEHEITNVWHKAKLRGVSFRAIGQEPGWLLEITDGVDIVLKTGYGGTTEIFPFVSPEVSQTERSTRFVVQEGRFEIILDGKECSDTMSGEIFETAVLIKLAGRNLVGCGRALH